MVCSLNKMSMVHRCPECSEKSELIKFLQHQFEVFSDELNQETIQFQQWQSTDRTQINNLSPPLIDFIDYASNKIDLLTAHSYFAKCQSAYRYLKSRKAILSENEALILADFSENYQSLRIISL